MGVSMGMRSAGRRLLDSLLRQIAWLLYEYLIWVVSELHSNGEAKEEPVRTIVSFYSMHSS